MVPEATEPELFRLLHDGVTVLQHGTDHRNRAAAGEKKTEYPAGEPVEAALARIADGSGRLRSFAGKRFFPVLTPPRGTSAQELLGDAPAVGLRGVTAYGPARAPSLRPACGR